jgi:hypothetical protein
MYEGASSGSRNVYGYVHNILAFLSSDRAIRLRCDKMKGKGFAGKNTLYYQLMVHTSVGGAPLSCPNTLTH